MVSTRDRAKLLRESILKVDKYRDALSSKKRQRSDLSSSERSSGVNLAKMGCQVHRNSIDSVNQRLEDKNKSVGINKRIRTSVADERVCVYLCSPVNYFSNIQLSNLFGNYFNGNALNS